MDEQREFLGDFTHTGTCSCKGQPKGYHKQRVSYILKQGTEDKFILKGKYSLMVSRSILCTVCMECITII